MPAARASSVARSAVCGLHRAAAQEWLEQDGLEVAGRGDLQTVAPGAPALSAAVGAAVSRAQGAAARFLSMRNSTRRFWARPPELPLSAIGLSSP
jgi:hypothetical protein